MQNQTAFGMFDRITSRPVRVTAGRFAVAICSLVAVELSPDERCARADVPKAELPTPSLPRRGGTLLPVPLVTSDSDNGVGFGAALAYYYGDGQTLPYRFGLVAQALFTTVGVSDDYLNLDWLRPFDSLFRVGLEIRYRREPNASWFGAGNLSPKPPSVAARYNQYGQQVPAARLLVQRPVAEHLALFCTYLAEYSIEETYAGSLLALTKPVGTSGGFNAPVGVGAAFDSRDSEVWTTRGQYLELSLRDATTWTGSRYRWQGATATWRGFVPLPWQVVGAGRALVDGMRGGVPFYDLDSTGSLHEIDGLGGANTMRGFVKDRFVGKGKVLLNGEFRRVFWDTSVIAHRVEFGGVTFADVGRVYGTSFSDGPTLLLHYDAGAGLRALIDRELVIRVDVGISIEGPRIYALFQNMF